MLYYNDVYAYDTLNSTWLSLAVFGTPMTGLWSFTANVVGNAMILYAGNENTNFYNSVAVLYSDTFISEKNFYFSPSSASFSVGETSSFNVEVRSSTVISGSRSWGSILPWATALDFSVLFIGRSNADGSSIVMSSKKGASNFVDNLDGTYTISYSVTSTSEFLLYISYYNTVAAARLNIPGSPFTSMTVVATKIAPRFCAGSGVGLTETVQGSLTYFYVALNDLYSNPINATLSTASLLKMYINNVYTSDLPVEVELSNSLRVLKVSYYAPYTSSYTLGIYINDSLIFKSPSSVVAYQSIEVEKSFEDGALAATVLVATFTLICIIIILKYWTLPALKASSPLLLIVSCIGCIFAIIGVGIRIRVQSLSVDRCFISPYFIGLAFCICTSIISLKAYRISRIFNSKVLEAYKITDYDLLLYTFGFVLFETVVQIFRVSFNTPYVKVNTISYNSLLTYHSCSPTSLEFQFILYGYKSLLLVYGTYIAFQTRNAPALFNESAVLLAIIANILFTSIIVLPLANTIETPFSVYGLEIYGVLWCVVFMLGATFLSKVIIYEGNPFQLKLSDSNNFASNRGKSGGGSSAGLELFEFKSSEYEKKAKEYFEKCENLRIENEKKELEIEKKQLTKEILASEVLKLKNV